jgi:predicted dehydrogenase
MAKTIEERLRALEDREEIIKLKARYANYNDGGWKGPTHAHPNEVADMFVEDGIWDGTPVAGYAKGREQIREAWGVPPVLRTGPALNVARAYLEFRDAILQGRDATPDFAAALARHRTLDAVERAASEACRITL